LLERGLFSGADERDNDRRDWLRLFDGQAGLRVVRISRKPLKSQLREEGNFKVLGSNVSTTVA